MIKFNSPEGEYGFMDNYFVALFKYNDNYFATVEQAFQYTKFILDGQNEVAKQVLCSKRPEDAKKIAMSNPVINVPQWQAVSLKIMKEIIKAKITQNADMISALLATGNNILVEENKDDLFYGATVDDDGVITGLNHVGRIIMEIRSEL